MVPKSTPEEHHELKGPMWKKGLPDLQQLSCLFNMRQTLKYYTLDTNPTLQTVQKNLMVSRIEGSA